MSEVQNGPNMGQMTLLTSADFRSVRGLAFCGYLRGRSAFYVALLLRAEEMGTASTSAAGGVTRHEWHTVEDRDAVGGISFAALQRVTSRLPELCAEVYEEAKKRRGQRAGDPSVE